MKAVGACRGRDGHRTQTATWLCRASLLLILAAPARGQDLFADAVASFTLGLNGGFGSEFLPGIVLGPPRGAGLIQGSFDVVALGKGGAIVLRFDLPVLCDGPGADFTVFENAFHSGSETGQVFAEFGFVAVSQDGGHFIEFPYDAMSHAGLAGQTPVLSHPENGIDASDPAVSGGDSFDLSAVGLPWAAYVRITDVDGTVPDTGDLPQLSFPPNAGFDLDAIAAIHACDPGVQISPSPSLTPSPTTTIPPATATAELPTATRTATSPMSPTPSTFPSDATPTPSRPPTDMTPTGTIPVVLPGDADGDGAVNEADLAWLIGEFFDGDGNSVAQAAGGRIPSGPSADANGDGSITAADLVGVAARPTD